MELFIVLAIVSFILGWMRGSYHATAAHEVLELENKSPSVRSHTDVGWGTPAISFTLRDGSKVTDSFADAICRAIADRELPNVKVVKGSLTDITKTAVFVDCRFVPKFLTFTIALLPYGRDLRVSWWQSQKGRAAYYFVAIGQSRGFWLAFVQSIGATIFAPLVLPGMIGYQMAVKSSPPVRSERIRREEIKPVKWVYFQSIPETEISALSSMVDLAIKEAIDDIGLGADAVIPLSDFSPSPQ